MKSYLQGNKRFEEVEDGVFQRNEITISVDEDEFLLVMDELTIKTEDYEFDGRKLTTESASVSLVFG